MLPKYRVMLFIGAWGGVDFGFRFTRCDFFTGVRMQVPHAGGLFCFLQRSMRGKRDK